MEILLTVCNLAQIPLTLVCIFALIIGFVMWLVFEEIKTETKFKRAGFWIFMLGLLIIPIAAASFAPQALIKARVQMIKLEVTDPEVREKLYENIDRIFKKVEEKYLGKKDKKKE